jgi:Fe-S-cluster containining protein
MARSLRSVLPEMYAPLLPAFFDTTAPDESLSTCTNCIMVGCGTAAKDGFSPSTKCCTYYPWVPGYAIGGLLQHHDRLSIGRQRVAELIGQRDGISPFGIRPPKVYSMLYHRGARHGFGRSETLLCPYFDSEKGQCSIWDFRDAVCATYFCRPLAGKAGRKFWNAIKDYLSCIQRALSMYVITVLMPGNSAFLIENWLNERQSDLTIEDLDGKIDEPGYRRGWADWQGKEIEFYCEAYGLVRGLTPDEFLKIVGIHHHYHIARLGRYLSEMQSLPAVLRRSRRPLKKNPDGTQYIFNVPDSRAVVNVPAHLLDSFDGRRDTGAILAGSGDALAHSGRDLLMMLYNYNVLEGVKAPPPDEPDSIVVGGWGGLGD